MPCPEKGVDPIRTLRPICILSRGAKRGRIQSDSIGERGCAVERIARFIEEHFRQYGGGEEARMARAAAMEKMKASYEAYRARDMGMEEAELRALVDYGAEEGARLEVLHARIRLSYAKFRRRYPWMIRLGVAGLVVLPPLAARLFRDVNGRAEALAAWTVAVIAMVAYVITVEYIDYRYQKLLYGDGGEKK